MIQTPINTELPNIWCGTTPEKTQTEQKTETQGTTQNLTNTDGDVNFRKMKGLENVKKMMRK